jgi:flagellar biosynthesis protein FliR
METIFGHNTQLFLLIMARVFAMIEIAPMISSEAIPQLVKIALSVLCAFLVFPWVAATGYPIPEDGLSFVLLLIGEAMVGIIMAFFLAIIYTAFQVSGQFFSLQMGFGASQVFDPLAQVEIPLMGQFLNLVAMMVFIGVDGFQRIFYIGVIRSFQAVRAIDFVGVREGLLLGMLVRLSQLFEYALILAFPILGTLVLVYVAMGLLAKAAPQMNLLILGFPISIGVSFLLLFVSLPFLVEAFTGVIDQAFNGLLEVLRLARGGPT